VSRTATPSCAYKITAARDLLLSRTALNAVRALMSGLMVAAISEYWEDEHFAPNPDFTPGDGGARRQSFGACASRC
jgi:hypothetical protein